MGLVCAGILGTPDRGRATETQDQDPWSPVPPVVIWAHDDAEAGDLAQARSSPRLPGFRLPDTVQVALSDRKALSRADLVISAVPVQFLASAWSRLRPYVRPTAAVLSVSKGIETETLRRPTQVIAETLRDDPDARPRRIGVLSGPTIAAELARCMPATMIAASDDQEFAGQVQRLFSTSWLRVYTNPDVLGVELAGATKNVIAIAAGILDGLQAGYNAKSALLARGLAEITRLGAAMGASQETFFGLGGVGDLATTCFSPEGRNRSLGEALGRGDSLKSYLGRSPFVVEGVPTAKAVLALARKYRVEMPITAAVHAVLYEGLDPLAAIARLMSRELKGERVG
ncbi:MAG: NAD(P)-dependent glycerol-3-phosphate dehydrogenase [Phycisphaerales bacterium]|nr:NAD(P)-dependent glycerol-3-phosphate dehydrogenase [Phycisphaerales bacterium]